MLLPLLGFPLTGECELSAAQMHLKVYRRLPSRVRPRIAAVALVRLQMRQIYPTQR